MKTSTFSILLVLAGIGLISCNDDLTSKTGLDNFQTNNTEPIRLVTTQNNNLNSWSFDEQYNFTTATTNDFTSWQIYINDGGGNFNQLVAGDCNRWQGSLNDKYTTYSATLETTVENDFNEWKYSSNTTYYIRTSERDNFNDIKFYGPGNNYLYEIKTLSKDNFNKWKFIDFPYGLNDPATFLYFTPTIITISQMQ